MSDNFRDAQIAYDELLPEDFEDEDFEDDDDFDVDTDPVLL